MSPGRKNPLMMHRHSPPKSMARSEEKEITSFRRQPESSGEVIASDAHSLVERVSTTSANEIDKLIDQLRALREFFQNEGQRIQREIDEYARLGDAVLKSTKTMVTNMAQLKYTGEIAQDKAE